MADVAAAAHVSQQTVSRVLNNHASVSDETRRCVLAAVAGLGYRPNLAARALATGASRVIGVLVPGGASPDPSGVLLAIEETARERGHGVSLAFLPTEGADATAAAVAHVIDHGVDAIIAQARTQAGVDAIMSACAGIPTVLMGPGLVPDAVSSVDIDHAEGVRAAMTLLKGLGHTRIAHVRGPAGDLAAHARAAAWREALPESRRHAEWEAVGDWSAASGYQAAMSFLALRTPPTAIVAADDRMAIGVLRALHERGLVVPRDMSVVGFDDREGVDCSIPPLTTIRRPWRQLGQAAVEAAVDLIAHVPPRHERILPEMVVRSSTATPG